MGNCFSVVKRPIVIQVNYVFEGFAPKNNYMSAVVDQAIYVRTNESVVPSDGRFIAHTEIDPIG